MGNVRVPNLPELPEGWTWHVSSRFPSLTVELLDATRIGRVMLRKENPGQFADGTPAYERLLQNGVHVGLAKGKSWRKMQKDVCALAEHAWLVSAARERLARATDDDAERELLEAAGNTYDPLDGGW